jgi:hypothetical protein
MRALRLAAASLLLASPLSAEEAAFDPWTESARYEFTYRVELGAIEAEAGDALALWIPLPAETPDQRVLAQHFDAPFDAHETRDAQGNRMLHLAWRGPAPAGAAAELRVRVERRPSQGIAHDAVAPGSPDEPGRHLGRTRRVPLDGVIEQIAVQRSQGLESDTDKIRAFYDYVVENMRYAKHGEGWGEGDAIWACTERYGNCTDFHSLFLGLARSQGIPARFHIGFPIDPAASAGPVAGYHCWADAWDARRGWVPFDASEAWKAKRFDDYFGTLPSDRIVFTTGRDLVLEPAQQGAPLNYFVYPYAERDGEPVDVARSFSFRRLGAEAAARAAPGKVER